MSIPSDIKTNPTSIFPPIIVKSSNFFASEDESPFLDKKDKQFIQQVTGMFLFYVQGVDVRMLTALSAIALEQSSPTEETMKKVKQFLDYAASQEDAVIAYKASDMVEAVYSDASYLGEAKAWSRASGLHFLSRNEQFPPNNAALSNISMIIRAVMSSVVEAELGALF
ncbi:hypothetical protein ACHAW6_012800 [Cyclotella cf. meneghiniana]